MFFRVCEHFPEVKWVSSRFSNPQPKSGMSMVVVMVAANAYMAFTVWLVLLLAPYKKLTYLVLTTNLWGRCHYHPHFIDEGADVREVMWLAQGHTAGKWQHQDSAQTFGPEAIFLPDMLYDRCCPHWLLTYDKGDFLNNRSMLWFHSKNHRGSPHLKVSLRRTLNDSE